MEKVTRTCSDKQQDSWDNHLLLHNNNNNNNNISSLDEKDNPCQIYGSGGITWPPRHYTCTFCRRKFKSAQALGGHMNVHRRDRALLRTQPPPWLLHFSPNPNPNPSSATLIPPLNSWMMSTSHPSEKAVEVMGPSSSTSRPFSRVGLEAFSTQKGGFNKEMSNGKIARLDLEIESSGRNKKEDLDLELRLGY